MQPGHEQLKDWMHRRRFLQQEAAEYLGLDAPYVSKLLSGTRSPGLDNAVKIERATGIPIEAWMESELDTSSEPVAASAAKPQTAK